MRGAGDLDFPWTWRGGWNPRAWELDDVEGNRNREDGVPSWAFSVEDCADHWDGVEVGTCSGHSAGDRQSQPEAWWLAQSPGFRQGSALPLGGC